MIFLNLVSTLLLAQLPIAAFTGDSLILTFAVLGAARRTVVTGEELETRLACLVPAHNEELLLPALLVSILAQKYPRDRFTLHIIADNSEDGAANVGL